MSGSVKIHVVSEVEMPRFPNYLRIVDSKQVVDVRLLSLEARNEFCEAWVDGFKLHCARPFDESELER